MTELTAQEAARLHFDMEVGVTRIAAQYGLSVRRVQLLIAITGRLPRGPAEAVRITARNAIGVPKLIVDMDELRSFRAARFPIAKIAGILGISVDAVRSRLKAEGLDGRRADVVRDRIDPAAAVEMYKAGASCEDIAVRFEANRKAAARVLRDNGCILRSSARTRQMKRSLQPSAPEPPDVAAVVPEKAADDICPPETPLTPEFAAGLHFDALLSVQEIMARHGIGRFRAYMLIGSAGRGRHRGHVESMKLRAALMKPSEKLSALAPAHEAARGRKCSEENVIRVVSSQAGRVASDNESRVLDAVSAAGLAARPGYMVGRYLIDVALPDEKIAVEVDGGNWHTSKKKAAQDRRKERFLIAAGWEVVRIIVPTIGAVDFDGFAQHVCFRAEILRANPSARRQDAVVWGQK